MRARVRPRRRVRGQAGLAPEYYYGLQGCAQLRLQGCAASIWLQALAIMAVISWFLAPALNIRTAHSAACNHSSASL
jgi:hypothetical protein